MSATVVQVLARALRPSGHVVFETSLFADFSVVGSRIEQAVEASGAARVTLEGLLPSTRYYLRCCACSPGVLERVRAAARRLQVQAELALSAKTKKRTTASALEPAATAEDIEPAPQTAGLVEQINLFGEPQLLPVEFSGPDGDDVAFQCSSFVTLPSSDLFAMSAGSSSSRPSSRSSSVRVGGPGSILDKPLVILAACLSPGPADDTSCMEYARDTATAMPWLHGEEYLLSCLLGDVFPATLTDDSHASRSDEAVRFFSTGSASFLSPRSAVRRSFCLIGWNDTRAGSVMDLMSEELAYKQHLHDVKKHRKKYDLALPGASREKKGRKDDERKGPPPPPPVLSRPEATLSFSSLSTFFPVIASEEVTRHCYRMLQVGPLVQVYVLDLREGVMGKAQARWLQDTLDATDAVWKIILAGAPLGLVQKAAAPKTKSSVSGEEKDRLSKSSSGEEKMMRSASLDEQQENNITEMGAGVKTRSASFGGADEAAVAVSSSSLQFVFASIAQSYRQHAGDEAEAVRGAVPMQQSSSSAYTDEQARHREAGEGGEVKADCGAATEVVVQSGIVLITAGTASPFVALLAPAQQPNRPSSAAPGPARSGEESSCFAVEVGVGRAHWSAAAATAACFEPAAGLGVHCLFGLDDTDKPAVPSQARLTVHPLGDRITIQVTDSSAADPTGGSIVFEASLRVSREA